MPVIMWPTGQGAGPAGSADYPAEANVLTGITYGSGTYTGTLTLPAESDVRSGVAYGPGGTGYNGTLYVRTNPAYGLEASLIAMVAQIPDEVLKSVTYYPRAAGDSFGDGVVFEARRQPLRRVLYNGLATVAATWNLYATGGQAVKVKPLGKIVDGTDVWHITGEVGWKFGDLDFSADCTLAVG